MPTTMPYRSTLCFRNKSPRCSLNVAFLVEFTLGHITFFQNLRELVSEYKNIKPTFIPIRYDGRFVLGKTPKICNDSVLIAGVQGYVKLKMAMVRTGFDILFFHTWPPAIFCSNVMKHIPSVVSIDSTPAQFASMVQYYWPMIDGINMLSKREQRYHALFRSAEHVIGSSQWAIDSVRDTYRVDSDRLTAIVPGVNLRRWTPGIKNRDGRPRLLFVGNDFQRKGGDLLLRWMEESGSRLCTLDVVTTADVRNADSITVHHEYRANDPNLIELFRSVDLLVLPTRADMTPWVIMEAMATGTPVLASRIGGIPELIGEEGQCGFLIEPDDYSSLERRLNSIIRDRSSLREMGQRARDRAELLFDGRRNLREEMELLCQVAVGRRQRWGSQ